MKSWCFTMADDLEVLNEQGSAREEIQKSIRDMLSLKMTIPLGNPNMKMVHTNQFLWCNALDMFPLRNMEIISKALNSTYARYSGYEKDRWYIEGTTIDNNGTDFTMDLELNPFASDYRAYRDARNEFLKAYTDAQESNSEGSTTTKSTSNRTLRGGQGEVIDKLVREIVGNETDDLKKCKLIHEWLRNNVRYAYYECSKYKTPENCYNNRKHLNCADTATLTCAMMLSAGLNAYIVHRTYNGGHFWVIIEIAGKKYASDQTGDGSAFNTVWKASGRTSVSNGGDYSRRNGNRPDC